MDYSSETSESAVREALHGLRLLVRGVYRLLKYKLSKIPNDHKVVGFIVLVVALALCPVWLSSLLCVAALAYTLSRSEKIDGNPIDCADNRESGKPGDD